MAASKNTTRKGNSEAFSNQVGKGRPKGGPNKNTTAIKDMIVAALDGVGGQEYLEAQAQANPVAFLGLIAKVMPTQLQHSGDAGIKVIINRLADDNNPPAE